ncbi:MAG: HNH/ENDO VII family nuclease [Algibacter sp.]
MTIKTINRNKFNLKSIGFLLIHLICFSSFYAQTYNIDGSSYHTMGQTLPYLIMDGSYSSPASTYQYYWEVSDVNTGLAGGVIVESGSYVHYPTYDSSINIIWNSSGSKEILVDAISDDGLNDFTLTLQVTVISPAPSTPNNPTISNSGCGESTLQRTGTPPSGVTWYWQGKTSNGTSTILGSGSTYTASQGTGTYYIRARKDDGTWSAGSGLVSVSITEPTIWYADNDADTLGDANNTTLDCSQPTGYVSNSNDSCPLVYGTVADNGCPVGCDYEDINRIISKVYNVDGTLVGHSKSYFNTFGKSIQTQSLDIKTNKIWATQTLYDNHGRPAFQSLSAPVNDTDCILYNPNFIKDDSNVNNYTTSDFDTNPDTPSEVGTQTSLTLGHYYSTNNTSEPYQDITSYPFSRTIYSTLNPGNVKKVIGGNKVTVNSADEWIQGYSFTMPVAQELHYAFGPDFFPKQQVSEKVCTYSFSGNYTNNDYVYEIIPINLENCTTDDPGTEYGIEIDDPSVEYQIGDIYQMSTNYADGYYQIQNRTIVTNSSQVLDYASISCGPFTSCSDAYFVADYIKATKTIARDVHGIESVVFTDSDGNTLAAARSGNEDGASPTPYTVVSPINEQGFVDIHIPVGCGGVITFEGASDAEFNIYDLVTEAKLNTSGTITTSNYTLNPGIYRIEEITTYHENPLPYVEINGSVINLIDDTNQVGVSYNVNYYDFSLNFYDKTGRLTQNIQPEGFDDALTLSTSTRSHNLSSTFTYNSVNELLNTTSPDEGTTAFLYRKDGQVRYSQNSKQAAANPKEISYTNYDNYGRAIESGVIETAITFSTLDPDGALTSGTTKEQYFTVYDQPDTSAMHAALSASSISTSNYSFQKFVASNVSKTYTQNPVTSTSWYSYDVFGRVTWLIQNIEGLGTKTIDYTYDAITGAVTKVDYQKQNTTERFIHKYTYNIADELTKVETSTDDVTYTTQADYSYYESGALKRLNIAEGLQGLDFVYNLNGELKSINHPSLIAANDPGGDNNDLFGMILDYNENDFKRPLSNITSVIYGEDKYDGNIKGARWNNGYQPLSGGKENTYDYRYNKNDWLEAANYGEFVVGNATNSNLLPDLTSIAVTASSNTLNLEATNSIKLKDGFHAQAGSNVTAKIYTLTGFNQQNNGDYNVSNITYDANGNIKSLIRNKHTESGSNAMDNLSYVYNTSLPNRLKRIDDAVADGASLEDIDDQTGITVNGEIGVNYIYNEIGQLIENQKELIKYVYNTNGLVTEVKKNEIPLVKFFYNDEGYRVKKEIYTSGVLSRTDFYVRNVSGDVLAIYEGGSIKEHTIYGADRLGIHKPSDNSAFFQLTDHLGNIRAVVGKTSNGTPMGIVTATDYYPYGMAMPGRSLTGAENYRYKYQGQEKDAETGKEAFQLRLWDSRIGRWLTPDPAGQYHSPYLGMGNNPVNRVDPDGGTDKKKGFWDSVLSVTHVVLDVAGMIPGVGNAADLINAGIYALEGDEVNTLLALAAAVPGAGLAVTGGKYVAKGVKYASKAIKAYKKAKTVILKPVIVVGKKTRKYWSKSVNFKKIKVFQRDDIFDPKTVSTWIEKGKKVTGTNAERMASGRAPIGIDGKSVNLHHMTQTNSSGIAEMTQSFHKKNHKVMHINPNTVPSGISRSKFDVWRSNYWKNRSIDF